MVDLRGGVDEMRAAFDMFDGDGDGRITTAELKKMFWVGAPSAVRQLWSAEGSTCSLEESYACLPVPPCPLFNLQNAPEDEVSELIRSTYPHMGGPVVGCGAADGRRVGGKKMD